MMLEFSKKILNSVSFDKKLFKKELYKNIGWLDKKRSNTSKNMGFSNIHTIQKDYIRCI